MDGLRTAVSDGTAATNRPIAAMLAEFACGLDARDVPDRVIERARLHVLDCIGIALASTGYDFGRKTLDSMRGLAGEGPSPVIGTNVRLPMRDAALVNGVLVHGLDYDDTHSDGVVHASASALCAGLAQGFAAGVSGRELLAAYLVGVESSSRIGQAAQGGFHVRGHHPTGLVGAFGAALTASRLAGLSEHEAAMAQGIALSMAAGSLEFLADGAWTKRIHPGWAAVAGITAAALAGGGFQGPSAPYEGRYGLYNLHLGADHEARLDMATAALGEVWELENVAFKPYPACHFNHAFADAALALRRDHGLRPEDVDSITGYISDAQANVVCRPEETKKRPQNSYDAQFSMHYTIAAALTHGRFTLDEIDPKAISDPEVLALAERVDFAIDPESAFPRYYSGEIRVRTRDGAASFATASRSTGARTPTRSRPRTSAPSSATTPRAPSARSARSGFSTPSWASTAPPTSRNSTPRSVGRDRRAGNRCCLRQRENSEGNGCRPGC